MKYSECHVPHVAQAPAGGVHRERAPGVEIEDHAAGVTGERVERGLDPLALRAHDDAREVGLGVDAARIVAKPLLRAQRLLVTEGLDVRREGIVVAARQATTSRAPRGRSTVIGLGAAEVDMGAYEYGTTPVCGNGATEGTEGCDDANDVDTDDCRNRCVLAACGDGVIRSGTETCDDGNTVDDDGCIASCQVATCGDGVVRTGVEDCDDGNTSEGDGCSATCTAESPPGSDAGTDAGTDPGPTEDGGCCSSSRGGVTGLWGALALALISRRRKRPARATTRCSRTPVGMAAGPHPNATIAVESEC